MLDKRPWTSRATRDKGGGRRAGERQADSRLSVLQHARVQEILINCGKFVLEDLVQVLDDSGVTFHILLQSREVFSS